MTLGFHAQVGAHPLEGDRHQPALLVPSEDGGRDPVRVGVKQGLGFPAPGRVATGATSAGERWARLDVVPVAAWRYLWGLSDPREARGHRAVQTVVGAVSTACREG